MAQIESDSIRAGIWQPTSTDTADGTEYLAVQQVVSCDVETAGHDIPNDISCLGCDGGWTSYAYEVSVSVSVGVGVGVGVSVGVSVSVSVSVSV